jgi:hypothetical protein
MSEIASEPKMQCAIPLLLIVGDVGKEPKIAVYRHIDGELLLLTPTGDREGVESCIPASASGFRSIRNAST